MVAIVVIIVPHSSIPYYPNGKYHVGLLSGLLECRVPIRVSLGVVLKDSTSVV